MIKKNLWVELINYLKIRMGKVFLHYNIDNFLINFQPEL